MAEEKLTFTTPYRFVYEGISRNMSGAKDRIAVVAYSSGEAKKQARYYVSNPKLISKEPYVDS